MLEDLRWLGLDWQEGPDIGGPSARTGRANADRFTSTAWRRLAAAGAIYPCTCSRRDVERAAAAPHAGEHEAVYPGRCRPAAPPCRFTRGPGGVNWRFRGRSGETVAFTDGRAGPQTFIAGRDFGDFIVWRKDGVPAYQLAVVVDDAAMRITEVVRGADLLPSTAQQILLYRALGLEPPGFLPLPARHGRRRMRGWPSAPARTACDALRGRPASIRPRPPPPNAGGSTAHAFEDARAIALRAAV